MSDLNAEKYKALVLEAFDTPLSESQSGSPMFGADDGVETQCLITRQVATHLWHQQTANDATGAEEAKQHAQFREKSMSPRWPMP
jgi:hypothetical protein